MERLTKTWLKEQEPEQLFDLLLQLGAEYARGASTKKNKKNERYIKEELISRIEDTN